MQLILDNVTKRFPISRGGLRRATFAAVRDVSLAVKQGETVGLVGESGCGKSTVARIAAGLHAPDGGAVRVDGGSGRLDVQMVFQNPMASLDPRQRIGKALAEAPLHHGLIRRAEQATFVADMLRAVEMDPSMANRFPHAFSGGQRQRIAIARALAVSPKIMICDEAVSALDVSVASRILTLLRKLQAERGLGLLFISHDLEVVRSLCDRVIVMYLGRVVEEGPTARIFSAPRHPYTRLLLSSILPLDERMPFETEAAPDLPDPKAPPLGCPFHRRCPEALPQCGRDEPMLRRDGPDAIACHLNSGEGMRLQGVRGMTDQSSRDT